MSSAQQGFVEGTSLSSIDAAFAKRDAAFETAKDVLDEAVRKADAATAANRGRAEEALRNAVRQADAVLSQVLAADPQARSVEADLQRRLRLEDARSDAERAGIMDRMVRELHALRGGGGTS